VPATTLRDLNCLWEPTDVEAYQNDMEFRSGRADFGKEMHTYFKDCSESKVFVSGPLEFSKAGTRAVKQFENETGIKVELHQGAFEL